MKFLFFQISVISAALSIQNSSVLSDTYNMTPFLGANNSYVFTPDNVLPNLSRKENFVAEHSSGKRKVRKNAKSSRKVSVNQNFDDSINDLSNDIYNKISAIKNVKSLLEETDNSEKFYIDKYFRNVQDFIKYGKIENSDDPLSIFFESLAKETYHLLFLVVVLDNKDEEKDKNKLKEELLNTLDVKFKDEDNLEVTKFFDERKLVKFLDNLTLHHPNTDGVCEITKLLMEFKSKISSQDELKNFTSTSDSIFYRKLDFNTSTTEIAIESPTTEKILKKKENSTNLNVKPYKFSKKEKEYTEDDYWALRFVLGVLILLVICHCWAKNYD